MNAMAALRMISLPPTVGCLTSTLRPEQRLRVAKDLPVIESKLVLPPVGDPLRAGGIGA